MKKIIVTGGSGFIGSNLVNYLIKKNYFVINIDKLTYSSNTYNKKKIAKNALKNGTKLKDEAIKSGLINEKKFNIIVNPMKLTKPN